MGIGVPDWANSITLSQVVRIDLGLEGDWSETVVCVWNPQDGFLGVPPAFPPHHDLRPALELYMPGGWIGIHCAVTVDGGYAVDEERLRKITECVDRARG